MKSRWSESLWIVALFAVFPAIAVVMNSSQRAVAADEEADQGRIVEISPDNGTDLPAGEQAESDEAQPEAPKYWIGLQGRPIDSRVLRTQLQLADDVGVVVENVVPDSPADKAGLRQHDILIAVNGEPVTDMLALQEVVSASKAKALELKLFRLAKETTISVTPEERPKDLPQMAPGTPQDALMGQMPQELQQLFRIRPGQAGGFRAFGPGMILNGQQFNLNQMPGGISVSVTREGDEPPTITVKKGDKTWTVEGDDEEALKKLPADVRPFVEQLVGANSQPPQLPFNLEDFERALPQGLGFDFEGADEPAIRQRMEEARKRTEAASERLLERMKEMERRMQDLEKQWRQPPAESNGSDADPSQT